MQLDHDDLFHDSWKFTKIHKYLQTSSNVQTHSTDELFNNL